MSFGDPAPYVGPLHDAGIAVAAQVNTTADVHRALEAGVDVLVAQGTEAGGHTGRRATAAAAAGGADPHRPAGVAAGGIATGRGMAAALVAGAAGVWIGTPLLSLHRGAQLRPPPRERVRAAGGDETVLTRAFDVAEGARLARALARPRAGQRLQPGRGTAARTSCGGTPTPAAGGRGPAHRRPGARPALRRVNRSGW